MNIAIHPQVVLNIEYFDKMAVRYLVGFGCIVEGKFVMSAIFMTVKHAMNAQGSMLFRKAVCRSSNRPDSGNRYILNYVFQ